MTTSPLWRHLRRTPHLLLVGVLSLVACSQSPSWRQVAAEDEAFVVEVPAHPRVTKEQAMSQVGLVKVHFVTVLHDGATYVAMHADYPKEAITTTDEILDMAVDGAVARARGKLAWSKPITFESMPGRAFEVRFAGDRSLQGRVAFSSPRLYQLTVSTYPGQNVQDRIDHFFGSFDVRRPPPAVPPSAIPLPSKKKAESLELQ